MNPRRCILVPPESLYCPFESHAPQIFPNLENVGHTAESANHGRDRDVFNVELFADRLFHLIDPDLSQTLALPFYTSAQV